MKRRILIVEDDANIRKNLKLLLESEDYIVEVAENGKMALDYLHQAADLPNLIILDLMMPVMDGFEFRKQQTETEKFASIPVAIMTADGHVEEKKAKTRAQGGLKKPADIMAILEMVERLAV